MKFGILLSTVALMLAHQAATHGGIWWALAWPGASLAIVASAYFGIGPRVFGKRPDGTMASYAIAALLPYLLLTWLVWHLVRLATKEDCYNEVMPGLLIGRRPLARELPENVAMVVDLTAEFPECQGVRIGRQYISLPTLDAGIPLADAFGAVVDRILESSGPVYVHCAQGHGRSGMLAAAVLVLRQQAATAEEAIERLRAARPSISLSRNQLAFVRRFLDDRTSNPHELRRLPGECA